MAKIKKVEVEPSNDRAIVIDGVKYYFAMEKLKDIDGVKHTDKLIFKQIDQKEYDIMINKIVKTLSKHLTKEELVEQLVRGIDFSTLRKIVKRIDDKKEIKRHDGCLGFKVGNTYIGLID